MADERTLIGEHGGPAEATRARANRLGIWLFFASESFLFAAVISARFFVLGTDRPPELNQPLGLAISLVLLLSSLMAYRAEVSIAFGDRPAFLRNVAATLGLGALFMAGVALEWKEGLEFFPPSTLFGSAFFTLIGLHAFHVLTGMLGLGAIWWLGRKRRFSPDDYWGAEGVIKYWHFVDLAWVFIYPTLYLVS